MRTTTTTFLVLVLSVFFTFTTKLSLVAAADEPEAVRDITGEIIRAGVDYNILSIGRGAAGGGVTKGNNRNGTFCLEDVIQEKSDVQSNPTPVTFTPVDPKKGVIRVSTDLNIEFTVGITVCQRSMVWQLAGFDEATKQYFITTRGEKGNPGLETLSNWFKIQKAGADLPENRYKLVYCPTVCDFCKPLCKDIGIYHDEDGTRRLALLSDDVQSPFIVRFQRAVEVDQLIRMN